MGALQSCGMNVHLGGDDVGALVMEMGSAYAKAGYAGDDSPKAVFPSHTGYVDSLVADTSQHPLLLVEQSFAASEQRSKMCEMMFEKFEVPAFFLSKDAVLSAFAAGRATGLVVDVGSSLSRVSPVHDGYILKKGITKNSLAGDAI